MELTTQDRTTLRKFIEKHFSLDEIKTLAFDLGLPENVFPCRHTEECAREFIGWCDRRGEICDLLRKVIQARPNFPIPLQLLQKCQTSSLPVLSIIKQLAVTLQIPVENIVLCHRSRKTMMVYVSFDEATYASGVVAKFKLFDPIDNQHYHVLHLTDESEHYFLLSKKRKSLGV
ncbi:MAG: hypothetical protein KIH69_010370 [Anaerolineae bacterium]|nr:hypothetical protein [Anaerolineae bacterium]